MDVRGLGYIGIDVADVDAHFMVEMNTLDDVGNTLDRHEANGTPISAGPAGADPAVAGVTPR